MTHFSEDFLLFFKDLAANNHKDWFDKNRSRYHNSVKTPFDEFVQHLIESTRSLDPDIPADMSYKSSIFRINRDIRFSKDKTPYKLNRSAVIGPNGKKDHNTPSLYFETGPEHLRIYTGVYAPSKDIIESIRYAIMDNHDEFRGIIDSNQFKETFGTVKGEVNKVLRTPFKDAAKEEPLLFNKSWYVYKTFPAETILRPNVLETITSNYALLVPFRDFLRKAINPD